MTPIEKLYFLMRIALCSDLCKSIVLQVFKIQSAMITSIKIVRNQLGLCSDKGKDSF